MTEEEYMALRPTNKAWKCPNCGLELYTVEVIKAHKERCKMPTVYRCPDCGWIKTTLARRVRCGRCGSLNLERELRRATNITPTLLIKADADEHNPENAHLIHP